jgi:hypothetical protein
MDPGTAQIIAGGLSALLGGLFGKKNKQLTPEEIALMRAQTRGIDASTAGQNTENQLSNVKLQRKQSTDPLFHAVSLMAAHRLPVYAQQGIDFDKLGGSNTASTAPTAGAAPPSTDSLLPTARRGGGTGGVLSDAAKGAGLGSVIPGLGTGVGALAGAVNGLFHKHASTAPSDFSVEDARTALAQAHQQFFGTPADPGMIDQVLRGQGWQPGDRWVGESGLRSVLQTWQQQAGARA